MIVFNDIGVVRCASCIPMRDEGLILALLAQDKPRRFRQLQIMDDTRESSTASQNLAKTLPRGSPLSVDRRQ
jgi:hypothetical protein